MSDHGLQAPFRGNPVFAVVDQGTGCKELIILEEGKKSVRSDLNGSSFKPIIGSNNLKRHIMIGAEVHYGARE